jgi:hypothetical protein
MEFGIILVIGILGVVACGLLIGLALTWKPAKPGKAMATPNDSAPAMAAPAAIQPAVEAGVREVLRVWRDTESEELRVELGGQRFARMADIRQAEVRQGLLTTLRDLEAFAGGAPTVPPVVVPVAAAHPAVVAAIQEGGVKPAAGGTAPLPAPSMNPFKQMQVLRELNKAQAAPVKSITEQIDEILQEKLSATPHHQRGIRVHSGPKGHALFSADGHDYDAVDNVPDAEVRGLIRAAVAEWEKKQ